MEMQMFDTINLLMVFSALLPIALLFREGKKPLALGLLGFFVLFFLCFRMPFSPPFASWNSLFEPFSQSFTEGFAFLSPQALCAFLWCVLNIVGLISVFVPAVAYCAIKKQALALLIIALALLVRFIWAVEFSFLLSHYEPDFLMYMPKLLDSIVYALPTLLITYALPGILVLLVFVDSRRRKPVPMCAMPSQPVPAPVQTSQFCAQCGHENSSTSAFCAGCGGKLEVQAETNPQGARNQMGENFGGGIKCPFCGNQGVPAISTKMSTGGWVLFVVLLFFCFPICWLPFFMSGCQEEVRKCASCGSKFG